MTPFIYHGIDAAADRDPDLTVVVCLRCGNVMDDLHPNYASRLGCWLCDVVWVAEEDGVYRPVELLAYLLQTKGE